MAKILAASLILILVAAVMTVALGSSGREVAAGTIPTDTPSPSPTESPSPTPSPTTAPTGTATASPSASASAAPLPAAAPQTGGQPVDGSDTLMLTLILGTAAIIGVGGVFAGKFALDRRS